MNSLNLTAAVTVLANAASCGMSQSELALAAGLFVQLGDTLATIAAERALFEERGETCKE